MSAPAKIGRSARNDPKIAEKEVRFNPFTYIVGLVKIAIFGEDPTFEEEEATWRSYDQATLLAMYDEMHTQAEEEERKRTTGQKYDGKRLVKLTFAAARLLDLAVAEVVLVAFYYKLVIFRGRAVLEADDDQPYVADAVDYSQTRIETLRKYKDSSGVEVWKKMVDAILKDFDEVAKSRGTSAAAQAAAAASAAVAGGGGTGYVNFLAEMGLRMERIKTRELKEAAKKHLEEEAKEERRRALAAKKKAAAADEASGGAGTS